MKKEEEGQTKADLLVSEIVRLRDMVNPSADDYYKISDLTSQLEKIFNPKEEKLFGYVLWSIEDKSFNPDIMVAEILGIHEFGEESKRDEKTGKVDKYLVAKVNSYQYKQLSEILETAEITALCNAVSTAEFPNTDDCVWSEELSREEREFKNKMVKALYYSQKEMKLRKILVKNKTGLDYWILHKEWLQAKEELKVLRPYGAPVYDRRELKKEVVKIVERELRKNNYEFHLSLPILDDESINPHRILANVLGKKIDSYSVSGFKTKFNDIYADKETGEIYTKILNTRELKVLIDAVNGEEMLNFEKCNHWNARIYDSITALNAERMLIEIVKEAEDQQNSNQKDFFDKKAFVLRTFLNEKEALAITPLTGEQMERLIKEVAVRVVDPKKRSEYLE
jgi:hypothetical protein